MKRIKESAQPIGGVNIAPVINVAFVLVIIMLMTAPILNIPNIPVDLPEAVTTESKERNVTVSLAIDGRTSVDEEVIAWDSIPRRLNEKLRGDKNMMVIIRADKDVMYEQVEDLIDMIKYKSHARRISVATKQRSERIIPKQ